MMLRSKRTNSGRMRGRSVSAAWSYSKRRTISIRNNTNRIKVRCVGDCCWARAAAGVIRYGLAPPCFALWHGSPDRATAPTEGFLSRQRKRRPTVDRVIGWHARSLRRAWTWAQHHALRGLSQSHRETNRRKQCRYARSFSYPHSGAARAPPAAPRVQHPRPQVPPGVCQTVRRPLSAAMMIAAGPALRTRAPQDGWPY
jgi:hypothetical protein